MVLHGFVTRGLLGVATGFGLVTPAWAACSTVGLVTTCDASSVQVVNVGGGPFTPDGSSLILQPGAQIITDNANAITYGLNASITIGAGALVEGTAVSGIGRWGRGYNTIEYGPNGTLIIEAGAQVIAKGPQTNAQAIDVIGGGRQVIVNHGLVSSVNSQAILFEGQDAAATNLVDNFGTIRAGDGASSVAVGNTGLGNFTFINRSGASVLGSFAFGDGNDNLTLEAGSIFTGTMDGGGGDNTLTLTGPAGSGDTFASAVSNVQTLAKTGDGAWTVSTDLGDNGAPLGLRVESGRLLLDGTNSFTGDTSVLGGVLQAGGAGAFSAESAHRVASGAVLALQGHDQTVAALDNGGAVFLSSGATAVPGTVLAVSGDYAGTGGVLYLNTQLGGDGSPTDLLRAGSTSGASFVHVTNVGGQGAATQDGIKIIDVAGPSDGDFALVGGFTTRQGVRAVVGGAYAYTLHKNGLADPADGDWYLRSEGVLNPGVGLYEAYPQALLELNALPSLQQRVGNRFWSGQGNIGTEQGADPVAEAGLPYVQGRGLWARVTAGHARHFPFYSSGKGTYVADIHGIQVGADLGLGEWADGSMLVGGVTSHLNRSSADVAARDGDGSFDVTGRGLGASLTWYDASGLYVDAQAAYSWYDSDIEAVAADSRLVDGGRATGYALSIEAGKRIEIGGELSLTPQVQLAYSRVQFDAFNDVFGAQVDLDDGDSLRGRIGMAVNRERTWDGDNKTISRSHLYGIANLSYEFLDGTQVSVSDGGANAMAFANRNDRLWGGLGAGGSLSWNNDRYSVHAEAAVDTSLNDFGESYAVTGTVGFTARW